MEIHAKHTTLHTTQVQLTNILKPQNVPPQFGATGILVQPAFCNFKTRLATALFKKKMLLNTFGREYICIFIPEKDKILFDYTKLTNLR